MTRVDEWSTRSRSADSFLQLGEKQVLLAIARRMPVSVTPDMLTCIGVFGSCLFAVAMLAINAHPAFAWLGVVGLIVNWLGDSLDGTIARERVIERHRYGFFVDHLSDLASQILIVVGLGLSPLMRFDVAMLALMAYLAISVYTLVKLHVSRTMQISYFGFGPTEIRLLVAVALVLTAFVDLPTWSTPFGSFSTFDVVGLGLVVSTMVGLAAMFRQDAKHLAEIDPPRPIPPSVIAMKDVSTG